MKEIVVTKPVAKHGKALGFNLTRELGWLGVGYGDKVTLIIRRPEDGDQ